MPDTPAGLYTAHRHQADLAALRAHVQSGATRPLPWRRAQLEALARMGRESEDAIFEAMRADLGKSRFETYSTEVGLVAHSARHAARNLRHWMRPRRAPVDFANFPGRARVVPEPLGVALILSPWNYPYLLALDPLVGALSAGCCAAIKPSELAPATSEVLARILPAYLDSDAVQVVEGGVETAQALLAQPFDHVFFTGSTQVGSKVMQAAARNLTPVTLELGGKSPVVLTRSADIEIAARRIAWGKCINAGQTCIAPDYVLAEPGMAAPFAQAFRAHVHRFFGADVQQSADYARIINTDHFDRLAALIADGTIACGGTTDRAARFIEPTVLTDVPAGAAVMQDEIFGPILPVIEVADLAAATAFINARPKPLALYLFSSDRADADRVIAETSSGGVLINDVVTHITPRDLPFGGVGASGMGAYHGRTSFDRFSHLKPVLRKSLGREIPLRYPPYSARKMRWLRRFF